MISFENSFNFSQDKTGEIDIRRFFQAIALVQSMNNKENEEVLKKAFQGFDKENTGAINSEEFKKIMITLGDILHESEVKEILVKNFKNMIFIGRFCL